VVEYARQLGLWEIIDITEDQANQGPIYDAIAQYDPASIYHFGHGNTCITTGDLEQAVWTCDECSNLAGRIVYLMSCLTAIGLGPAIMAAGGRAYAGFNVSWTWLSASGTDGDPYLDVYARGFYESANEVWIGLLDGEEFRDAAWRSYQKYTEWIDYWYNHPDDPRSQDCIKYLAHDRDSLVVLDQCEGFTTSEECIAYGCHWYDNGCHSMPQTNGGVEGFNWVVAIPIVALVGVALVVGTK